MHCLGKAISIAIFSVLLCGSLRADEAFWDLNDVTVLYPLPTPDSKDTSQMLSPTDPKTGAVYLDTGFEPLYAIGFNGRTETLGRWALIDNLRIIGVRFDPCFRDLFTDSCIHQIRITWQPVVQYNHQWITIDAAAHTFYSLNDQEWTDLVSSLRTLEAPYFQLTRGQPLQPHPALVREGLDGRFARGLREILSKYATVAHLFRGASTNPNGSAHDNGDPSETWDFTTASPDAQGVLSQALVPNVISGVAGERPVFETVGNASKDGKDYVAEKNAATGGPFTTSVLKDGVENILELFMGPTPHQDLAPLYRSALKLQQPDAHLPGTTDCVSCHVSTGASTYLEGLLPRDIQKEIQDSVLKSWNSSPYNLKNLSPRIGDTRVMRALGYAGSDPAISWRVIYESAHVADEMNKSQ